VRRFSWLVTLPLLVVAVVFAVANRQTVPVRLWPLRIELELPLFLLVLGALGLGLLAGMVAGWLGAGGARRRAREERARAEALAAEVERLHRDQALARPAPDAEPARRPPLRLAGGQR